MASRIIGVGNIIGYIAGFTDLPVYFWFFGNSQFKILCAISCIGLAVTVLISITTIRERDPRLEAAPPKRKEGLIAFFKQVFKSIGRLPPQTRKVCEVQFFAWIGYFPQLFYSSSYVGDIYVQPYLEANPHMTEPEIDSLYEQATRVGTFALLIYAIVSLATNVLLPFFIAPSFDVASAATSVRSQKTYTTFATRCLDRLVIPGLTMFSTLIVRSVGAATALIGITGISWALTLWAPFAIISAEVSKRDAVRRSRNSPSGLDDGSDDQAGVILGIHNMSVASPQILATLGSSLLFKFLQKPRGTPGDRSIAVVLACGGLSTLVAVFLTSRIKDEVELPEGMAAEQGEEDRERGRRSASLVRSASFSGLEY
jgi:solute carrier family 45 protein 1/2/4